MTRLDKNGQHLDYVSDNRTHLQGSQAADAMKRWHKTLSPKFYGCDLDFVFVQRSPYKIIAIIDYKERNSDLSAANGLHFSSAVAYFDLMRSGYRVFIVFFDWKPNCIPEFENIDIWQLTSIDPKPNPPKTTGKRVLANGTIKDLELWEKNIRELDTTPKT